MQLFEIHILKPNGGTAVIATEAHLDAHSAIRSAMRLACGRQFEVWKGVECIFGAALTTFPKKPSAHSRDP
jgi:hypothetical protein